MVFYLLLLNLITSFLRRRNPGQSESRKTTSTVAYTQIRNLAYWKYISHQEPLIYLQSPGPSIPLQSGIPTRSSQRSLDQSDQQPYLSSSHPIVPTDTTHSLHLVSTIRYRFWTHTHYYSIGLTVQYCSSECESKSKARLDRAFDLDSHSLLQNIRVKGTIIPSSLTYCSKEIKLIAVLLPAVGIEPASRH